MAKSFRLSIITPSKVFYEGDVELLVVPTLEGEEGFNHIKEYADGSTTRGKNLRKTICEKLKFDSLDFQSLDGIVEAIGLPKCDLCTYCWDGEE